MPKQNLIYIKTELHTVKEDIERQLLDIEMSLFLLDCFLESRRCVN